MNKILIGFLLIVAAVVAILSTYKSPSNETRALKVTASFYPLAFFASEIGGEYADVQTVTPANVEPHDYDPTAQDIIRLHTSDVVIINGGGFEPWSDALLSDLSEETVVVTVSDGLATLQHEEDGKSAKDPHVWLSPVLAKEIAQKIGSAFETADQQHAEYYAARTEDLAERLDLLHAEFQASLSSCQHDTIVTSHAAFGYLADAYGLRQISVTGISPESEPSAEELRGIADFARANNVEYIFFESLVSPKLSQTIANEVGAKTLVLNPLEGLTQEQEAEGNNYFTEMRRNVENLKIALVCPQ